MIKSLSYVIIISFLVSSPYSLSDDPQNYCQDSESWTEWENLARKYPSDQDIQHLHALRIGLCIKIEQGSITQNMAVDIFDKAREFVIEKKKAEQKKSGMMPGGLSGL